MVNGAYLMLKTKFNYQWGYLVYCEGTDEFTDGNNTAAHYNHYGQSLNSGETTGIKPIWDNLYGTIEPANLIIANVPAFYNPQSPTYNARLGEGYFLRGYGYFELVKQFGGIPLKLTPSTGVKPISPAIVKKKYMHKSLPTWRKPTSYCPKSRSKLDASRSQQPPTS